MLGTVYDNTLTPATLNVEQDVVVDQHGGIYVCQVDLAAMLSGDTVEFRAYMRVRSGGATNLCRAVDSYTNAQTIPIKDKLFAGEIAALHYFKLSIKQTAGTLRAFPLVVLKIA